MPDEATPAPPQHASETLDSPKTLGGILKQLGPGLIIAGSIVGSGELIATTAVGAEAGFVLMWLIIIGCLIKVFVQIEFGKYAIINGKTTLDGMNEVPGPRWLGSSKKRANWICWFWLIFIVVALAQLGGIIGGVGQAMSIQAPLTEQGKVSNDYQSLDTRLQVIDGTIAHTDPSPASATRLAELKQERQEAESALNELAGFHPDELAPLVGERKAGVLIDLYQDDPTYAERVRELEQERESYEQQLRATNSEFFEAPAKHHAHVYLVALQSILRDAQAEGLSEKQIEKIKQRRKSAIGPWQQSNDTLIWAGVITFGSIFILVLGRYRLIQNVSTALVAMFTFVTIGNLILLQSMPERMSWTEFASGMTFSLPSGDGLATALFAFGIIGVGATELIQYPYWCLEKGYARWTGPRDESDAWAKRAEGWVRVLKWDAWCSMVVYTFATIAFYLLGAATLHRKGLNPEGAGLVRTLGEMYVPVFGEWAQGVFLFGAFAVLYSTFFVATASHARVLSDGLRVFGLSKGGDRAYVFWTRIFCGVLPVLFLATYAFIPAPKQLVLAGGFMGALMLPLLGVTALYGRYHRGDARLMPGKLWDALLWLSVLGLFIAGGWAFYSKVIEPFV